MPRGLIQPFQRDLDDFANADGAQELQSRIEQVLGTRGTSPNEIGEMPWRPEFGSALHRLRHRNMDETIVALARTYVGDSLRRWVPELSSVDTEVEDDQDKRRLVIRVRARRARSLDIKVDTTFAIEYGSG